MKKLCVIIMTILLLFVFSCAKKKQKEKAPNLEVETTQVDTVLSSDEAQNITDNTQANETQVEKPKTKEYKFIPKGTKDFKIAGNYSVQLISLTNYDKILSIKRKLAESGYKTTLSTIQKDGKTFYRLRLASLYTKKSANEIGNEIKNRFDFITGYWIQKSK